MNFQVPIFNSLLSLLSLWLNFLGEIILFKVVFRVVDALAWIDAESEQLKMQ
jgi:hypothetical protein